ncbi:zinc iron permease [Phlebopus sp. FC_14]|nr:zinc iron permease [Phlebopus sp. FC_14]
MLRTSSQTPEDLAFISSVLDGRRKFLNRISEVTVEGKGLRARIIATLVIFSVSLLASSFPSTSKHVSFLRIPRIVFFIGKHFGTGVILSTAFVHLLQDAFEALRDPLVLAKWNVGAYTGLIALGSLLSIFFVEYISTSYVDRLQSYSSPSVSPRTSPRNGSPSRPHSRGSRLIPKLSESENADPERASLLTSSQHQSNSPPRTQRFSYGSSAHLHHGHEHGHECANGEAHSIFEGHHRHEPRGLHRSHHERGRRLSTMYGSEEFGQGVPGGVGLIHDREAMTGLDHDHVFDPEDEVTETQRQDSAYHDHDIENADVKIGKKRQLVGILVLQLGIMIHSLVIGLTLAITSGPEFTSLLVAIIFHQLFEGLSLGIRIASLPSSHDLRPKCFIFLKPILTGLFAITTPIGIILGIAIFGQGKDLAHMRLIQGLMCAISAGMLIYAACVEMLAGDFVMDPILWRSGLGKQALALVSLAAGVTAMALVGS